MSDMTAKLYRDGKLVKTMEVSAPARSIYVPITSVPTMIGTAIGSGLPAHVLADRYNSDYDEYFPISTFESEVYVLVSTDGDEMRFEYERTHSFEASDRR